MMNPEENEAVEEIVKSISLSEEIVVPLIQHYISMQKALAADDFESAKTEAKAMMKITGHSGEIANLIHTMLDAQSIDEMRKPHFEILSNSLIDVLKAKPDLLEESLYIMHCPMVYGNTGADWLQDNDQLRNPYFGSMMLKCGEVKEELRVE
jgi:Cu(I)/Ag(I) efflux system membrane fusion protein